MLRKTSSSIRGSILDGCLIYALRMDPGEIPDQLMASLKAEPHKYVLKPQREGGGVHPNHETNLDSRLSHHHHM